MTEKFNQERYDNFRENFLDGIEMPEGFINSAWQNDVFPSIAHESGRVHIWFTDVDGWIGDFKRPPEGWKKYEIQGHPTKEVYAEEYALAGDPNYVKFETNDWNEILEKIEEWRATQTELKQYAEEYALELKQKVFRFHDGDASFTLNALEILTNDTEEDEPDLYEFARNGKVGDFLSGANVNGIDVTRIQ